MTNKPAYPASPADWAGWAAVGTALTLAPAITVWIVIKTFAIGGIMVTNPAAIIGFYFIAWVSGIVSIGIVAEVMDQ